jgi:hypothetical protein
VLRGNSAENDLQRGVGHRDRELARLGKRSNIRRPGVQDSSYPSLRDHLGRKGVRGFQFGWQLDLRQVPVNGHETKMTAGLTTTFHNTKKPDIGSTNWATKDTTNSCEVLWILVFRVDRMDCLLTAGVDGHLANVRLRRQPR